MADGGDAAPFANEPDTPTSPSPTTAGVVAAALATTPWPSEIAAVVDGEEVTAPLTGIGIDPSSPSAEPLYRYVQADLATVERAVAVAHGGATAGGAPDGEERRAVLHRVAAEMAAGHGTLLSAMARDAGKIVAEADSEVSEAIDSRATTATTLSGLVSGSSRTVSSWSPRRGTSRTPSRRRARRTHHGQYRHPEARPRDGARRRDPRPAVLGRRRTSTRCSSCRPRMTTSANASSPIRTSAPSCSPAPGTPPACS